MTLHQAETELRMAALAYAAARERFHRACASHEIRAECDAFVHARHLLDAVRAEHRVSP